MQQHQQKNETERLSFAEVEKNIGDFAKKAKANTLKPDVDPEQAVDNPATPPSGETLDRADASALNNVRTGPK